VTEPANVPLVSVVIPTYNAPAMLLETLETVFAQTFQDFEVVVINDGSTDGTATSLKPLDDAGKIRLINQPNGGIGDARNRGIDEARGKYIALLDHDDLWHAEKLAAQVAFMESHPDCAACSVPWSMSPSPETPVCDFSAITDDKGIVKEPLQELAHGRVFLISSSLMVRRDRIEGLRYMRERRCIEDTPFQVRLFARGDFGIAGDKILMVYRVHASNYSSQADFFYNGIKLLRRLDREHEFNELTGHNRRAMHAFFAHLGRSAVAAQLTNGLRKRAAEIYLREMLEQAKLGRWKFLLCTPGLLCVPTAFIKRIFPKSSTVA